MRHILHMLQTARTPQTKLRRAQQAMRKMETVDMMRTVQQTLQIVRTERRRAPTCLWTRFEVLPAPRSDPSHDGGDALQGKKTISQQNLARGSVGGKGKAMAS